MLFLVTLSCFYVVILHHSIDFMSISDFREHLFLHFNVNYQIFDGDITDFAGCGISPIALVCHVK